MATKKKKLSFVQMRRGNERFTEADWSTCDANSIRSLIICAAGHGGAVRFGYSRDRGAYSVGVYIGGENTTEYMGLYGDLAEWLSELESDLDDYGKAAKAVVQPV